MKHIGFVDYYISEWHANNYPAWIEEAGKNLNLDYTVSYCYAEKDVSPVDGVTTDEWCEKMGVTRCGSISELCEKSDVIIILAPSDPQKHLKYAQEVLPFGKRTYIDKTFAPDYETAKEIFRIAKEYNTPFFSTSALRYAAELKEFSNIKNMVLTGGGGNFEEYIIHLAEIAITLLKTDFKSVKTECISEKQVICRAKSANDNEIAVVFSPELGYGITVEDTNGEFLHKDITSEFFLNLITDIIEFFETGKTPFDTNETLQVAHLRNGFIDAISHNGEWINI